MKKTFIAEVGERPLVSIDKECFVKTATEWQKLARMKKEWRDAGKPGFTDSVKLTF